MIENLPHLTPPKVYSGHKRVGKTIECNSMWSARIIRSVCLLADKGIPDITIAVKRSYARTVDGDIVTSDYEGS